MVKCNKCNKEFTERGLLQHRTKRPNCINKCPICLKVFTTAQSLKRHEIVKCKPRYQCNYCDKTYNLKNDLKRHQFRCNENTVEINKTQEDLKEDPELEKIQGELSNIVKNMPNDKNITMNIHIYQDNKKIDNSKIDNRQIDNRKVIVKNTKNKFLETTPKAFTFEYKNDEKYKEYAKHNEEFDEELANLFYWKEEEFKETQTKETLMHYTKQKLEFEGFKMLHNELQKYPEYQNVRIKKAKSGKCYIYDGSWREVPLQKTITQVCQKLCNSLYDKETSVNQFINLLIKEQPRRMQTLRQYIEQNIIDLNYNQPLLKNEEIK